jgi:tRNA (guanine-N7-)-methyltransferase
MSFGLGRGKELDDAPGIIGVAGGDYPPLPDSVATDPESGRLDPRGWFPQPKRPFELEIGCGKGSFILEESAAQPGTNYLGIEWAREFYLYASDRLRRAGRSNVRMLHADATDFVRWRLPSGVCEVVHLYFSDPWPKSKHHKNRVVQHRFLAEVWRVLRPRGELRIVTDHDALWAWDEEHIKVWTDPEAWTGWIAHGCKPHLDTGGPRVPERLIPQVTMDAAPFMRLPFTPPAWVGEGETVATNYERKMCVEGKVPHACVLRKG